MRVGLGLMCNPPNSVPQGTNWSMLAYLDPFCTPYSAAAVVVPAVPVTPAGLAPGGMSWDTWNSLTPAQQSCSTNPNCDFSTGLIDLFNQDLTGTGAGALPDASGNPPAIPSWVWFVGLGIAGVFVAESGNK